MWNTHRARWIPVAALLVGLGSAAGTQSGTFSLADFLRGWQNARQTGTYDARADLNGDKVVDHEDADLALQTELLTGQKGSAQQAMLGLRTALKQKNAQAAAAFFTPENRARFQQLFTAQPAKMTQMAEALTPFYVGAVTAEQLSATVTYQVAPVYFRWNQRKYTGRLICINGVWMVKDL